MAMLRKTWVTVLGWVITLAGLAALVLPGPGLLLLLAGLAILSQEYEWAERRVDPIAEKAFAVAEAGVATWPRIMMSTLGGLCLIAVGVFWWLDPDVPEIWFVGPKLPFGGWATGSSVVLSGFIALGLLAYSARRFRAKGHEIGDEDARPTHTPG